MASIRKRREKWQVQIRRKGSGAVSRTFRVLKDAQAWARHMEARADRGELPAHPEVLRGVTLHQLVERYRDTVSPRKRTHAAERAVLNVFLRHSLCRRAVSEVTTAHFAAYRDEVGRGVERCQGCHVYPDSVAVDQGDNPQWLYTAVSRRRSDSSSLDRGLRAIS